MQVTVLTENTALSERFQAEHGLSLLIRAGGKTLLFDAGQTDALIENVAMLGEDLAAVDAAVISHGHYDHTGGLPAFRALNATAPVYVRENAFRLFRHGEKDISVPVRSREVDGIVPVRGDLELAPGILLFTGVKKRFPVPKGNDLLTVCGEDGCRADDFSHEQNLAVTENGRTALFAGCAHCGIMNILAAFYDRFGRYPDTVVGGFHMMKETDEGFIRETARLLKETGARFYTGHCTGNEAFRIMREILGEDLRAISAGLCFQA